MMLRRRGEALAGGTLADQLKASVKSLPVAAKTEPAPPPFHHDGGGERAGSGPLAPTAAKVPPPIMPGSLPVPQAVRDAAAMDPSAPMQNIPIPKSILAAPPPLFASANLGEGVQPDFQRIVETLFSADAFRDYDDLEKNLEVGESRGDLATLREHLDKAEGRARRAHKLLLGAKLELVSWEADQRRVLAAMREKARVELEDEKADGTRRKVIGKEDVEDRIADLFPDEWKAQQIKRAKMKGAVDDIEHLTKRWDAKCVDLRTLLETLRR